MAKRGPKPKYKTRKIAAIAKRESTEKSNAKMKAIRLQANKAGMPPHSYIRLKTLQDDLEKLIQETRDSFRATENQKEDLTQYLYEVQSHDRSYRNLRIPDRLMKDPVDVYTDSDPVMLEIDLGHEKYRKWLQLATEVQAIERSIYLASQDIIHIILGIKNMFINDRHSFSSNIPSSQLFGYAMHMLDTKALVKSNRKLSLPKEWKEVDPEDIDGTGDSQANKSLDFEREKNMDRLKVMEEWLRRGSTPWNSTSFIFRYQRARITRDILNPLLQALIIELEDAEQ